MTMHGSNGPKEPEHPPGTGRDGQPAERAPDPELRAGFFRNLPVLETARLVLRPLTLDDVDDVYRYASDPEVARYTTWEAHRSLEDSRAFVEAQVQAYEEDQIAPWAMVLREAGRVIGTTGFVAWAPRHARAELGYAMGRSYWGRGLMTEAVRAVVAYGFTRMGLNRIEARCIPENRASARVMEKAGMRYEGLLREVMYSKGRFVDLCLYAILRREWAVTREGRP
ncbi:GCN5-related N-acetyltransferase [Thermaerobacter marianensis DSM 12885]|uniref:GCN5-related N-acetyltransferase n=2 Tax=Thermaerobacter marianensis TaxID=73919 RepID=E6SHV8_THEM7|nr:GCN5-related N-acetyltransferase [Thermaerobacter marianensis DSM 12885]